MNPFRKTHLLKLLALYDQESCPLDLFMSLYFRAHKAIGSKDRAFISETVYSLIRWIGLLDYLLKQQPKSCSWENRVQLFFEKPLESYVANADIPPHIQVSFPEDLFIRIGSDKALALALNERAPTTVRVNTLKISRDALLKKWTEAGYNVLACTQSPCGIVFQQKINFFSLEEFTQGYFEVQDEASQCAALLVKAKPGDEILDFCSGSGGKALAIAPQLQGKGQIHLHDIRKSALIQAKKRLKRAGIQNGQCLHASEEKKLKLLEGRMNWVFVDAPCSGTGTLRRNPDMKWKYSDAMVERLVQEQRAIFKEALRYLTPKGKIVYATCSILAEENEQQVEYFLKHYPVECSGESLKTVPAKGGPDGFFACVFQLANVQNKV